MGEVEIIRLQPKLQLLAHEHRSHHHALRQHLGGRESGYLFPSPRGGHYSKRRFLRHRVAQRLADQGMPENLLQRFLGHDHPATIQVYYEPSRPQVKKAFREATE